MGCRRFWHDRAPQPPLHALLIVAAPLLQSRQEEWFGDPDAVRNKVGLIDEQPSTRRVEASSGGVVVAVAFEELLLRPWLVWLACAAAVWSCPCLNSMCMSCLPQETCKICFESFPVPDMHCARCKHYYCKARRAGSSFNLRLVAREGCHWSCSTLPAACLYRVSNSHPDWLCLFAAGLLAWLHPDCHRQRPFLPGPALPRPRCGRAACQRNARDEGSVQQRQNACMSDAATQALLLHWSACYDHCHGPPGLPICRMCALCVHCLVLHFMLAECKAAVPRSVVFSVADAPHRQR